MKPHEILFDADGRSRWAGMGNYCLVSPDRDRRVVLEYVGEPPHGDSYHHVSIDGRSFPGFAWGCMFAFSRDSRYLAFSWMARMFERKTVVVDLLARKYAVLPVYVYDFAFDWPLLAGVEKWASQFYRFSGVEDWVAY